MTDYKKMYLIMVQASEKAIRELTKARKKCLEMDLPSLLTSNEAIETLIAAQQECEEIYLTSEED